MGLAAARLICSHDGYGRLVPGAIHRRTFTLDRARGALEIEDLLALPLAVTGGAQFRVDGFDLSLRSTNLADASYVLSGLGDREPLQIDVGLLQVFGQPAVPFTQGVFRMQWQNR